MLATIDYVSERAIIEMSRIQRQSWGCKTDMEKTIVYQSPNYKPHLVTGVYVRCNGRKGNYIFRVFEAGSGGGKPGMGATLREYDCDGSAIPAHIRTEAIATKTTIKWSD